VESIAGIRAEVDAAIAAAVDKCITETQLPLPNKRVVSLHVEPVCTCFAQAPATHSKQATSHTVRCVPSPRTPPPPFPPQKKTCAAAAAVAARVLLPAGQGA
jgi:hypothetical protein